MQEFILDFFVEPLRVIFDQVSFIQAIVLEALKGQIIDIGVLVYNISLGAGRVVLVLNPSQVDAELRWLVVDGCAVLNVLGNLFPLFADSSKLNFVVPLAL